MHHITGNGLRHGHALHRDTLERLCGQTHCYGHILIQFLKCNYFAPQSRCRVLPRPSRCHPWYIKRKINNESEKNKRRHPPGTVSIFRYLTSQLLLFLPSFLNITFYSCLRWKIFFFNSPDYIISEAIYRSWQITCRSHWLLSITVITMYTMNTKPGLNLKPMSSLEKKEPGKEK